MRSLLLRVSMHIFVILYFPNLSHARCWAQLRYSVCGLEQALIHIENSDQPAQPAQPAQPWRFLNSDDFINSGDLINSGDSMINFGELVDPGLLRPSLAQSSLV